MFVGLRVAEQGRRRKEIRQLHAPHPLCQAVAPLAHLHRNIGAQSERSVGVHWWSEVLGVLSTS